MQLKQFRLLVYESSIARYLAKIYHGISLVCDILIQQYTDAGNQSAHLDAERLQSARDVLGAGERPHQL